MSNETFKLINWAEVKKKYGKLWPVDFKPTCSYHGEKRLIVELVIDVDSIILKSFYEM